MCSRDGVMCSRDGLARRARATGSRDGLARQARATARTTSSVLVRTCFCRALILREDALRSLQSFTIETPLPLLHTSGSRGTFPRGVARGGLSSPLTLSGPCRDPVGVPVGTLSGACVPGLTTFPPTARSTQATGLSTRTTLPPESSRGPVALLGRRASRGASLPDAPSARQLGPSADSLGGARSRLRPVAAAHSGRHLFGPRIARPPPSVGRRGTGSRGRAGAAGAAAAIAA